MLKWLFGLKGLITEWYVRGEEQSKDRLRLLLSNYNANIVAQLIGSGFWTGMLLILHADDATVGTAAMIPSLFFVLQILSPVFFERFTHRKKLILVFRTTYYAIQTVFIGLIPLFPLEGQAKLSLLLIALMVSHSSYALQNPAYNVWTVQSLPEKIRPAFFSVVNVTVNLICAFVPLLGGLLVDALTAVGMEYRGLLILRFIAFGLVIFDVCIVSKIREYPYEEAKERFRLRDLVTLPLQEKRYRWSILVICLDSFAVSIPGQYHLLYMMNDLEVSYSFLTLSGLIGMLAASFFMAFWKPVLQRWGWMRMLGAGTACYGIYLTGISFMFPNFTWTFLLFTFINSMLAGSIRALAVAGLPYYGIPKQKQTVYLSAYHSLSNLSAMLGIFFGKCFIGWTESLTLNCFGLPLQNKQYLCILAALLCAAAGCVITRIAASDRKKYGKEREVAAQ